MSAANKTSNQTPPFCPSCDREGKVWRVVKRAVEQTFRDETLQVTAEVTECKHCRFRLLTDAQTDALTKLTADAYRRAHGLLTSGEIAARRRAMELSQREFACWVGVGPASIKRWELALVQDKGSDLLIRARTDHLLCFMDTEYELLPPRIDTMVTVCAIAVTGALKKTWNVSSTYAATAWGVAETRTASYAIATPA